MARSQDHLTCIYKTVVKGSSEQMQRIRFDLNDFPATR